MTGTIKGSDSDGVMPLAPADAQRDETLADSAPTEIAKSHDHYVRSMSIGRSFIARYRRIFAALAK